MPQKLLAALLFSFVFYPVSANAEQTVIVVDGIKYAKTDTGIEQAIADLPAAGGVVELTPGTYALSTAVTLSKSNVTIQGSGRAILRLNNGSNNNGIYLGYYDNLVIKDLEIDGNRENQSAYGAGIKTSISLENILIENCYIHGFRGAGVFMNRSDNVTIRNCRIENIDTDGIQMHASTRYNIISNSIAAPGRHGIFLSGAKSPNVNSHFMVRSNTIANCGGEGNSSIHVWGAENGIISGNIIRDNDNGARGTNAVYLRGASGSDPCNITVSENTMQNISGVFVELSSGNVLVYGNTFKGSGGPQNVHGNGIFINSGVNNVIISSNMMSGANQHGIYCFNDVSNISICGNSISNSGQSKAGSIAGIRLMNSGVVRDIQIKDNRIYDDQAAKTQSYGIYASGTGRFENIKISGNILSGHAVADTRGVTAQ